MSTPTERGSGPLNPGQLIGRRYRIDGLLGSGGIAHVYRAHDRQGRQAVAIKVLTVEGDPGLVEHMVERFNREVRIVHALRHPNIVKVLDFGFLDKPHGPYLVMELLAGHDLDTQLRRFGPMGSGRAIRLMSACLDAIGAAHEAGVVHKDLKPANIFLADPGTDGERLVVLDFGGATAMWDERITQLGKFMGTPKYLAPEYIEFHHVSPALDVYQVGLVLAELLTGISPVPDLKPLDCATRHLSGELVLSDVLMGSEIGDVLELALARETGERFAHGAAFAAALRGIDAEGLPNLRGVTSARPAISPPHLSLEAIAPLDVAPAAPSDWTFLPASDRATGSLDELEEPEAPTLDLGSGEAPTPPSPVRVPVNREVDFQVGPDDPALPPPVEASLRVPWQVWLVIAVAVTGFVLLCVALFVKVGAMLSGA